METSIREAKDKKRFYKPCRRATFALPTGALGRYVKCVPPSPIFVQLFSCYLPPPPHTHCSQDTT